MEARRARRREKKKQRMARQENIPCIVFLATDEESFELAEKKEDRQLRYINQYADAHGLIPMKIVRKSCFAPYVVNQMYSRCIDWMQQGKAEAILVANMEYLALDEEDAYRKVGQVRKAGFRIYSRAIRYHAKNQRPFKTSVGFGRVMRLESDNMNIPIWEKAMLTKQEAALYSHIGINKLEEMLKVPNCPFVLYVGKQKLIKRREFEEYLSEQIER